MIPVEMAIVRCEIEFLMQGQTTELGWTYMHDVIDYVIVRASPAIENYGSHAIALLASLYE